MVPMALEALTALEGREVLGEVGPQVALVGEGPLWGALGGEAPPREAPQGEGLLGESPQVGQGAPHQGLPQRRGASCAPAASSSCLQACMPTLDAPATPDIHPSSATAAVQVRGAILISWN